MFPQRLYVLNKKWKSSLNGEWSWFRAKMERIKQSGNIAFHFFNNTTSVCLQFYSIPKILWIRKEKRNNESNVYPCTSCHLGPAGCPQQKGRCDIWSVATRTRTFACRTSSPLFHSCSLSISYHLFLSCTKPDEGHLTDVPIAMQKSNILAAPWPVNNSTSPSWQDLPLLSATLSLTLL